MTMISSAGHPYSDAIQPVLGSVAVGRLPTFLIIGVAKAATSSLYAYLGQHPQIYLSPERVPNFFGRGEQATPPFGGPVKQRNVAAPTLTRYCALFADAQNEIALGEGSSFFNFTPRAAQRIHHYIPDAKLLVMLRQPAERIYSQYLFARRMGWEPSSSFITALDDEPKRQAENWFPFLCYRTSGLYAANLRAFYERFPASQIQVSLFDEFQRKPIEVMRAIYHFLGVDPAFTPNVSVKHNRARVGLFPWLRSPLNEQTAPIWHYMPNQLKEYLFRGLDKVAPKPPPLAPRLRTQLTSESQTDILETQALIGRDLSHWLV